jgi:site-specific DNA-methyltransferase (adenine-specific)
MAVEMRPLATVRPYPGNPRCNDGAVDAVAASIRQFGFRQPIVVDGAGVIIAGHTRLKAAERLGLKEVPVHVAADLTPAQVRAYRLADNKTAELADWDLALLAPELMTVKAEGIDLLELGFSAEELAELLGPGLDKAVEQPSEPNPEQWLIVITCANESEQKTLLARLQKEGLACQCVIS